MTQRTSGISVAFLDVLSCSLGAMILLFLVFSTLSHHGDRSSRSRDGLPLEAESTRSDADAGDSESLSPALFVLRVSVKGGISASEVQLVDPKDDWATVLEQHSGQSPNSQAWLIWVAEPKSSDGKALIVKPHDKTIEVVIEPQFGGGGGQQTVRLLPVSDSIQPRLTLRNRKLTP